MEGPCDLHLHSAHDGREGVLLVVYWRAMGGYGLRAFQKCWMMSVHEKESCFWCEV